MFGICSGCKKYFTRLIWIFIGLTFLILYMVHLGSRAATSLPDGSSKVGRVFMPAQIKVNFDSVAGSYEAKEELRDVAEFLKDPERFARLGAKIPKGVLLIGEPGNGKTLLAKALAGEANCPFISISASEFVELWVGAGAKRVRELFALARRLKPCIIFIDEIDAVGEKRVGGHGGGYEERNQTLNQLLTEMDGFDTDSSNGGIIVVAATNRYEILDPALLRPGRFDRRVFLHYPNIKAREEILDVHIKAVTLDSSVDIAKIARGTQGFSGADLANLVNEAALAAAKDDTQKNVTMHHFEEARDKILLGKESKSIAMSEQERKVTAYHEAGHALVRLLLPDECDPLHKITIIPREKALGVTFSIPEREKHLQTKAELLGTLKSCLGGRAAEEFIFGAVTTGACNDFEKATALTRSLVCKYGMSNVGLAVYDDEGAAKKYSHKSAELIDAEIERILQQNYAFVLNLFKNNSDKLHKLAQALLENETMYAGEVYPLLGITPRDDFKLI